MDGQLSKIIIRVHFEVHAAHARNTYSRHNVKKLSERTIVFSFIVSDVRSYSMTHGK